MAHFAQLDSASPFPAILVPVEVQLHQLDLSWQHRQDTTLVDTGVQLQLRDSAPEAAQHTDRTAELELVGHSLDVLWVQAAHRALQLRPPADHKEHYMSRELVRDQHSRHCRKMNPDGGLQIRAHQQVVGFPENTNSYDIIRRDFEY